MERYNDLEAVIKKTVERIMEVQPKISGPNNEEGALSCAKCGMEYKGFACVCENEQDEQEERAHQAGVLWDMIPEIFNDIYFE